MEIEYPTDFMKALADGWEVCTHDVCLRTETIRMRHQKQDLDSYPITIDMPKWLVDVIVVERHSAEFNIRSAIRKALAL